MNKSDIKHIDDESLCIQRKRYGKGYQYFDEYNNKITDKRLIKRFKSLIIPPMWTDVMICKWDDGHIQATGRDAKGRKQYVYHSEWERKRQEAKFTKMSDFGHALPDIRNLCDSLLKKGSWTKDKVLALLVSILDETGIRIGNQYYAQSNGTYGLTTLRRKHLHIEDEVLKFEYKGKSNQPREVHIEDHSLIRHIKKSAELPGYELFRYKSGSNHYENIDSEDVNNFIRQHMGDDFSSKDFRTWVATRMAVELYPFAIEEKEKSPRKKFTNILIKMVSDEIGNTPSVCRSYYVHPTIMQMVDDQKLPIVKDSSHTNHHSESERVVLKYI